MILYLDTSSLVKLYLDEEGSEQVREWAREAGVLATSRVAYAEATAALARRWREGDLDEEGFRRARTALADQWGDFAVIEVAERSAAELAVRHALRGFDAIHLAAALELPREAGAPVAFTCFDSRLGRAATQEGLELLV